MSLDLALTWEGHRVRMVGTPEEPLWVAKDVCFVLGLHGPSNVSRDVPEADKGVVNLTTPGGPQPYVCVREAGLYRLISRSRKPSAQRFQAWLFGEVLPCIRKHGCYPASAATDALPDLDDPRSLRALCLALTERRLRDAERLAIVEPKAAVCDALTSATGDVGLQESGRLLHQPPNLWVARLIEDGILFRGPHGKPTPFRGLIEQGYFRVVMTKPDSQGQTFTQAKVTPLGMTWLAARYRDRPGEELSCA